jgi:DNA-binding CsgD family transcriptional regulator
MISMDHQAEIDIEGHERRIQRLEREIFSQRETIDRMGMQLVSHDNAVGSLRTYIALMVATWQSEIGLRLGNLASDINNATADDPGWAAIRRQVDAAHADFSRHIAGCSPPLTETETRICLLLGMELTFDQIARTLNCSRHAVEYACVSIRVKLENAGESRLWNIIHSSGNK